MLRNSARQTGHQVAKKNRNTGCPWLESWAVDLFVPSKRVNSKWGIVSSTLVPTPGCVTITAALARAAGGTGVITNRGVDAGNAVDLGKGVISGPDSKIDGGTIARKLCTPATEVVVTSNDEPEGASVADAPQAVNTIPIANIGRAIIFNIRWPFPRRTDE